MKLNYLVKLAAVATLAMLLGCGAGTSAASPSGGPAQDNFFATWEIDSASGARFVDLDLVNVDTGSRAVFTFDCDDYQGTSGLVDAGHFDVLLNLTDGSGAVLAQTGVGVQHLTRAGTVDLGHHIFQIP